MLRIMATDVHGWTRIFSLGCRLFQPSGAEAPTELKLAPQAAERLR